MTGRIRVSALSRAPIAIGNGCWVGAFACLSPGTMLEDGAVLSMGMLGTGKLVGGRIYRSDGTSQPRVVRADRTGDTN